MDTNKWNNIKYSNMVAQLAIILKALTAQHRHFLLSITTEIILQTVINPFSQMVTLDFLVLQGMSGIQEQPRNDIQVIKCC